jgi:hypothetical protein
MPETLDNLTVAIDAAQGNKTGQGEWRITWTIGNRSDSVLWIDELRLPHDQFRSADVVFKPPIQVAPRGVRTITTNIQYSEPPGSMLTYPFLIARASWNNLPCRLFGRLRVEADEQGAPRPICEEVTIRPINSGQ